MNEQEERNVSDIVGPGWYLFITVFSLSMLYYLTLTEIGIWYAISYSTFWGSATWGLFGFVSWIILTVDEYGKEKPGKKTVFGLDPAFVWDNDRWRIDHISFDPPKFAGDFVAKQADKIIDDVITANGLKLDNTVVVLNDKERKEVAELIRNRWVNGNIYFEKDKLSDRVLSSLKEYGYVIESPVSRADMKSDLVHRYRLALTDKGKKLFPYHLDGIYVK